MHARGLVHRSLLPWAIGALSCVLAACGDGWTRQSPVPVRVPARATPSGTTVQPPAPSPAAPSTTSAEPTPFDPAAVGCCAGCENEPKRVSVAADAIVIDGDEEIEFEPDKAVIRRESLPLLSEIACLLHASPGSIEVAVHHDMADEKRWEGRAMRPTQARADAIRKFLVSRGIDPARLRAVGYGATQPLARGRTPAERDLNRRVEIRFVQPVSR